MSYSHDHDHDHDHNHDRDLNGSPAPGDTVSASASGMGDHTDHDHDHDHAMGGTATPPDHSTSLSYASSTDQLQAQAGASASHPSGAPGAKRRLPPHIVAAFESAWVAAGNNTPPSDVVAHLAHTHGLELQKVRTWYNNRKAKEKRQRASQTIEVSSAGVTSVEGLAAATSAFIHNGQPSSKRRRSDMESGSGYYSSQHMSPAAAPLMVPTALPAGPLVPGQPLTTSPQPEHVLHTVGGPSFSIDHLPAEFTPDMFMAMRDRIIQLENYIVSMSPAGQPHASAAAAHAHHASQHMAAASSAPAGNALPPNVVAHLTGIVRQLRTKLEAKFLPESFAADAFEVDLAETMTVDEFIGCFDERGGVVASVMKHAAPEWAKRLMGPQMHQPGSAADSSLVSVEFSLPAPIRDLFGEAAGAAGGRLSVYSRAKHVQVPCELVKVVVLYDKESGRVFMQFGLRLVA